MSLQSAFVASRIAKFMIAAASSFSGSTAPAWNVFILSRRFCSKRPCPQQASVTFKVRGTVNLFFYTDAFLLSCSISLNMNSSHFSGQQGIFLHMEALLTASTRINLLWKGFLSKLLYSILKRQESCPRWIHMIDLYSMWFPSIVQPRQIFHMTKNLSQHSLKTVTG